MTDKKKYTVKDFCKKYNEAKSDEVKEILIKSVMNVHYVPYEMKVTICENIIKSTYYQTVERNGINIKKLHVNSPAKYMLYCLDLVKQYTHIEIDFKNSLEEFNMLNKELLDIIITNISDRELKEFRMILDMVEGDVMQNEYETHTFISNQVERFGELAGVTLKPLFEQLIQAADKVDEKTVDKLINGLGKLSKINIVK